MSLSRHAPSTLSQIENLCFWPPNIHESLEDTKPPQGGAVEQIGGSRMPSPLMYVMATLKWLYKDPSLPPLSLCAIPTAAAAPSTPS